MSETNVQKIRGLWSKLSSEEQRELLIELDQETATRKGQDKSERDNIYKRGKSWYVRLWADGREIRRSAGRSKEAARILLTRLREDAERGRLGLPKKTRQTVADWAPKYMTWAKTHKKSAWRDEIILKHLIPKFGHLKLTDVTKTHVAAYQRDRQKRVSGPTVNREVAMLRKLLSHAVEAGELESNPLSRVRMLPESPARQPTLEPTDEQLLLQASPQWLRLMVRLAVATGCRQGELLALRWRHVDLENELFTIEDSKSGESRQVPIHPAVLDDLHNRRGLPEGYIVTLPNGTSPARHTVRNAFKKATKTIGRGDLRFHDLRHVAGTRLLATGANLPEVAAMLGHKTLAMSKRYSHVSPVRLRQLMAAMPVENGQKSESS